VRERLRGAYRLLHRLRRVYWFVFRPRTTGVKCVVMHDGRWLMIRNSYGRAHWTFPGGGVDRGEAPDAAAIREVSEEVGITLDSVRPIGDYYSDREYKRDTVYCFTASVGSLDVVIDPAEIAESSWVDPQEMPDFRAPSVDRIVAMIELHAQP
jgi:8-oxo-dGTP pyrophosphatase MutT (NUDIX family)